MAASVENLCHLLARSRLLPTDDIRTLRRRWNLLAHDEVHDLDKFTDWLVANRYVTPYHTKMLLRGHADHFYLNDYKLLDRVGKGRMAGVYKAVHRLGQVVAIKVLPRSRAKDPLSLARFHREARLARQLTHPNVVRTFHTGEYDGLHYLVMEYLEGETLHEVLERRGRLAASEAARLVSQALMGLQHLHDQDMVHRDLCPDNLMLVPAAETGQPDNTPSATLKVLDIGLGRAFFDEGSSDASLPVVLTKAGDMLGMPDYMAPEQARDAHTADIRADIYSLGCVLYHALAGQPPFPDSNLVRQMVRHATEAPRSLKYFNPEVPEGLLLVIDRMLAKDPARRYPVPERAAEDLQECLQEKLKPRRPREAEPRRDPYLQWLEDKTAKDGRRLATGKRAATAAHVARAAAPVEVAPSPPTAMQPVSAAPHEPPPVVRPLAATADDPILPVDGSSIWADLDEQCERRARRRKNRMLAISLLVILTLCAVAAVIILLSSRRGKPQGPDPDARPPTKQPEDPDEDRIVPVLPDVLPRPKPKPPEKAEPEPRLPKAKKALSRVDAPPDSRHPDSDDRTDATVACQAS